MLNFTCAPTAPPLLTNDHIECQVANTPETREIAYKIRYEAYFSYNYILRSDTLTFSDQYDGRRNVTTLLIYKGGVPAATARVCLFDSQGTALDADRVPAMEVFDHEIRSLMTNSGGKNDLRAVEVTRLARRCDMANDKSVLSALFRAVGYIVLAYDPDIVLNACRAHHIPIYQRFGFRKVGEPRPYPRMTYEAALLACLRPSFQEVRANLPFLKGLSVRDPSYRRLLRGELVEMCGSFYSRCRPMPASMVNRAA
jgi:hypothetical protein